MFDVVKSIEPSARKPAFAGWANDIRLMREKDGRDHRDMCSLFRWASQDSFWCGNVLCPAKLREKWSQLAIKRDKAKNLVPAASRRWTSITPTGQRGYSYEKRRYRHPEPRWSRIAADIRR